MSVSEYIDLDVFLRGNRNYVQGTQLIARAAECLGSGDYVVKKAAFTQITNKLVSLRRQPSESDIDPETTGYVVFTDRTGQSIVHGFYDIDADAPQIDRPFDFTLNLVEEDEKSATYNFGNANQPSDMLDIMVQAIKGFYSRMSDLHYDIWFTGMRNIQIPLGDVYNDVSGTISFNVIRSQHKYNQYQTLQRVVIKSEALDPLDGLVSFAHKKKEA